MDQLIKTAGSHAARRVRWRLGGWCGRLGHGLASPVVGAALCYCGARGGSVGRLPLLCVRSDVSRRAASWTRGGVVCFWRLCSRSRPSPRGLISIISAGSATEVWSGAAGDVSYRASSAIGLCAGGMVAFWGPKWQIRRVSCSRCRMTSPSTWSDPSRPRGPQKARWAGSRGKTWLTRLCASYAIEQS